MAGMSRPGMLWPGTAGLVLAGKKGHGGAWRVLEERGESWQAWPGKARYGEASRGNAWQAWSGCRGQAGRGQAGLGTVFCF